MDLGVDVVSEGSEDRPRLDVVQRNERPNGRQQHIGALFVGRLLNLSIRLRREGGHLVGDVDLHLTGDDIEELGPDDGMVIHDHFLAILNEDVGRRGSHGKLQWFEDGWVRKYLPETQLYILSYFCYFVYVANRKQNNIDFFSKK